MSLDLSATLFGVLPGGLAGAVRSPAPCRRRRATACSPPRRRAGALLATYVVFRLVGRGPAGSGRVLLTSTVAYGAELRSCLARLATCLWWCGSAAAGRVRCDGHDHPAGRGAARDPDELRGRVSAIYQMCLEGGPALGDTLVARRPARSARRRTDARAACSARLRRRLHWARQSGARYAGTAGAGGGQRRPEAEPNRGVSRYDADLDTGNLIGNTIRSNKLGWRSRGQGRTRLGGSGEEVRHREGHPVHALGARPRARHHQPPTTCPTCTPSS